MQKYTEKTATEIKTGLLFLISDIVRIIILIMISGALKKCNVFYALIQPHSRISLCISIKNQ
ncbi:hypothetical protein AN414_09290 [Serratia marcescens]|nr:hypothetical protein AN414_09290 [Serratia marcescens]